MLLVACFGAYWLITGFALDFGVALLVCFLVFVVYFCLLVADDSAWFWCCMYFGDFVVCLLLVV